jgi:hypothetical protein
LWAIPVNYSKDEMNLLITVLPLLHKLSRLAVSADSKPNLLEPLHFHKPFERLTDLRVNTTYTSFPHTFFESNICPALEHLYVSAICYVEEIHEMDVVERAIISFVNRHKNRMRTLGVTYANNLDMDVSAFVGGFGKLKMIETFMINGKWDLRTDSRPSPLQILLEKEPIYLREIDIAGTTDRPPERGVHPALLNTVPIHLPYLSILKLGILFEVSASSITWIRSILPQLHTLWLSCATLEADTLQKLFNLDHSDLDGAESTKAEPTYEKLRNLLLRMTYPTTFTIDALAKRFPSVRMLKLVMRELRTQSLQSGGSETARRVTSLVSQHVLLKSQMTQFLSAIKALVLPHGRQWPYFEELVRENWPLHNFTAIVNMSDSETMIRKPFNGHLVKIKQSDCGCTDCRGVDSMPVGYC